MSDRDRLLRDLDFKERILAHSIKCRDRIGAGPSMVALMNFQIQNLQNEIAFRKASLPKAVSKRKPAKKRK
jgi:hypothetical protein